MTGLTIQQMRALGLGAKLGIIPMIGINDVRNEIFTLEDARQLLEYAQDNPDVASLGIWSLGRDNQDVIGDLTLLGSGLEQDP